MIITDPSEELTVAAPEVVIDKVVVDEQDLAWDRWQAECLRFHMIHNPEE